MKSPDAIKKSLNACSADECHGAHRDCEYATSVLCVQNICGECDKAECCCKMCIDTDGKDGFEWDGGTE